MSSSIASGSGAQPRNTSWESTLSFCNSTLARDAEIVRLVNSMHEVPTRMGARWST